MFNPKHELLRDLAQAGEVMNGSALMPQIEAISDPDRLQALLDRIPEIGDLADLNPMLQ